MQLSKIMIGGILTMLVVTGVFFYLGSAITTYQPTVPSDYNESFVTMMGTFEDLENSTKNTEGKLNISTESGSDDFLGYFFSGGYKAAQTATSSIKATQTAIDVSVSNLNLGGYGQVLKSGLTLMVLVVFVVGLILYLVTKSDRL